MKHRAAIFAISWLMILLTASTVPAQESADSAATVDTRMTATYLFSSTDTVTLTAGIMVKRESGPLYLANAEITLRATGGKDTLRIGTLKTDETGTAVFRYGIKKGLPANPEGLTTYILTFAGTDKYPGAETTIAAKPVYIRVSFEEVDSVRNILVTALDKSTTGEDKPVQQVTVNLYVKRLFSLLKIGEVALDEQGKGSMEFPRHLIGDSLGMVFIYARIDEHDVYASAQGENKINWAIPKHYFTAEHPSRELWTPIAPVWMIVTLIIMLAGVWAHYVYAVYQLLMIRQNSRKNRMN